MSALPLWRVWPICSWTLCVWVSGLHCQLMESCHWCSGYIFFSQWWRDIATHMYTTWMQRKFFPISLHSNNLKKTFPFCIFREMTIFDNESITLLSEQEIVTHTVLVYHFWLDSYSKLHLLNSSRSLRCIAKSARSSLCITGIVPPVPRADCKMETCWRFPYHWPLGRECICMADRDW